MTLHELLAELVALSKLDDADTITPKQRKRLVLLRELWQQKSPPPKDNDAR